KLREAFGPVIDRLAKNGIDLARMPVEVTPIAHYHMGGIKVAPSLESDIATLFAAGEAIGGANGANRLSGNAITEALVFGRFSGAAAAARARAMTHSPWQERDAAPLLALVEQGRDGESVNCAALIVALQALMSGHVGPFRTEAGLREALAELTRLKRALGDTPPAPLGAFDTARLDWFDLRNMLLVAEAVAAAALARTESRGAHQREDLPSLDDEWAFNQTVRLASGRLELSRVAVAAP